MELFKKSVNIKIECLDAKLSKKMQSEGNWGRKLPTTLKPGQQEMATAQHKREQTATTPTPKWDDDVCAMTPENISQPGKCMQQNARI
jgi:hypothetical protein